MIYRDVITFLSFKIPLNQQALTDHAEDETIRKSIDAAIGKVQVKEEKRLTRAQQKRIERSQRKKEKKRNRYRRKVFEEPS